MISVSRHNGNSHKFLTRAVCPFKFPERSITRRFTTGALI